MEYLILVGYFDYAVIAALVIANIRLWKKNIKFAPGCLLIGLFFGLVLPVISMMIEIEIVTYGEEIVDNFTLLYTFLRFPLYWILAIIQLSLLALKKIKDKRMSAMVKPSDN